MAKPSLKIQCGKKMNKEIKYKSATPLKLSKEKNVHNKKNKKAVPL
jgi:hypothetical protein